MAVIKVGEKFLLNTGEVVEVIKYVGAVKGVTVRFEEGNTVVCSSKELRAGYVKNPLRNSVLGKACIGEGAYDARSLEYRHWMHMLQRVYLPELHIKHPNYSDAAICTDWHNFQNFAQWCQIADGFSKTCEDGRVFCLDRDLLYPNNKLYSPETCCFIPNCINVGLEGRKRSKTSGLPTGVFWHKATNGYIVSVSSGSNQQHIGCFRDLTQAKFEYNKAKTDILVELAQKYRWQISEAAYQALNSVDISERFTYN